MLFWQDDKDKPSIKKIIAYSIAIPVILILIGIISDKLHL